MSLTKCTPGPWVAKNFGVFAGSDCIGITDTDNATLERYAANASLMAAAPDLYAALDELMQKLSENIGVVPTGVIAVMEEEARPALAKARGAK